MTSPPANELERRPDSAPGVGRRAGLQRLFVLSLLAMVCLISCLLLAAMWRDPRRRAVIAMAWCLILFWIIGWVQELGAGTLGKFFQYLSLLDHYENFTKGVIDTRDLVYCLSFIYFFLFLTKRQLESQRWRA